MALGTEHRSKFAALDRLHMSETFSSGTKNSKQTNKTKSMNRFEKNPTHPTFPYFLPPWPLLLVMTS